MKSLSMSQPHLIVMVGIPGSGKSFFAGKFAQTFNVPYVSFEAIDAIVDDADQTERLIALQLGELFKTKQSIVFEGSAVTRDERKELTQIAKKAGYQTLFIWVQTDPDSSSTRARRSGWTDEELEAHSERFSSPHPSEKLKVVVVSGKHTFATQLKIVLKWLSAPRAEQTMSSQPAAPPPRVFSDVRRQR